MSSVSCIEKNTSILAPVRYEDFSPHAAYLIIKTACLATINDIVPQFNSIQVEYIVDMLHDQAKTDVIMTAWLKTHSFKVISN